MTNGRLSTCALGWATIAAATAAPAAAQPADWDRASDAVRSGVVAAAIVGPVVEGDWNGALQAGGAVATAGAATYVLKRLTREERPDGSDRMSFPSGHTSASFAAAASLGKRHGWKSGVPAMALATFVGLARVRADRHYVHDVFAGAVLGTASGLLLTDRRRSADGDRPGVMTHGITVSFGF